MYKCKLGMELHKDLGLPYDRGLDEQALLHSGHDVHGHEVLFHGICVGCKRVH